VVDNDCPPKTSCSGKTGMCKPDLFYQCHEDDVVKADACGNVLEIATECGKSGLCIDTGGCGTPGGSCACCYPPKKGDLKINEVLLDPKKNDVNSDGKASGTQDEFIEIVTTADWLISLGGVTIEADTSGSYKTVHKF